MEFIPIEKYTRKNAKKEQKTENKNVKNFKKSDCQNSGVKKVKRKQRVLVTERQNKCKETFLLKRKKNLEEEEGDIENVEKNSEESDGEEENKVDNHSEENDKEKDNEDNEFKKKCKELDEKKKNRLFLKLKKKIYSETQIKELHPDIRSVIFPRKKNPRWCWAVFASEEKANEAMKKLLKTKDIFVNKPNPYEKVMLKRKEKMKTVLLKKEARKKLQKMWM